MLSSEEIVPGWPIETFLGQGTWGAGTCGSYRHALCGLRDFLHGTLPSASVLAAWRRHLQGQGYHPRSINTRISAANNYFRWCGRHDLVIRHTVPVPVQTPELTRAEYLRLLCTARRKGEHRLYLLVKLFATTGLSLQCLGEIIVPLVRQGGGTVHHGGETLRIPPGLQDELLEYCGAQHIAVGPVFVTSHGQVLNRSNLCRSLQELCRAARVDAHKGNPRALRSLYQATQASIRASLAPLLQKTYDQLLQAEQTTSGWHAGA